MEGKTVGQGEMAARSLDKAKFLVKLPRIALRIPKQQSYIVAKILSKYVLDMPRVKHIVPDPSDASLRLVVLAEGISELSLEGLPDEEQLAVKEVVPLDAVHHDVVLDYSYWPVEHILKDILPSGCEVPSSFETIGHIAHLNLRDDLLPHKNVIASVILDKNPKLKTVVNKVGTITNEFRVPEFEILAGDLSLVTEIRQHGATFRLDYGSVYWNSRLEGEHKRLFTQFKPGQIICDMFAGIGPFAVPAAQQGCIVYANDLNPTSVKYLKINSELNKLGERVKAYNMDARAFMREVVIETPGHATVEGRDGTSTTEARIVSHEFDQNMSTNGSGPDTECEGRQKDHCIGEVREDLQPNLSDVGHDPAKSKNARGGKGRSTKTSSLVEKSTPRAKPWEHFDHVIMNLPASALEFLGKLSIGLGDSDVFHGLLSRQRWKGSMPRVHCYCFMRSKETIADIIKKAENYLGDSICEPKVYTVRDVAPNKIMLCVSFDVPEVVAFATPFIPSTLEQSGLATATSLKRLRTE